jgi:hypothetical protein
MLRAIELYGTVVAPAVRAEIARRAVMRTAAAGSDNTVAPLRPPASARSDR